MNDRLAMGRSHTCVILDSGHVACWGDGGNGRLGYGNTNTIGDNETPDANPVNGGIVPLPDDQTAIALALGEQHSCALLADGTVTCWGRGTDGRLGYGNINDIGDDETPADNPVNNGRVPLPDGLTAIAISAGDIHTCALLADHTISCWGYGTEGELGYGNTNDIGDDETPADNPASNGRVPLPGGQTAIAVTVDSAYTCAILADGNVTCWGYAADADLGYGNTDDIGDDETPATNPVNGGIVPLPDGLTAIAITNGCALLSDQTLTCWGNGFSGQLGYGNTNTIGDDETPADNPVNNGRVSLPGGKAARAIASAGGNHRCVILTDGSLTCWGYGVIGQLGYGNTALIGDDETPAANPVNGGLVPLPGGQTVMAVAVGSGTTCALLANGTVTCWGLGDDGRLGYGNTSTIGDNETPAANPVNGGIIRLPGSRSTAQIAASAAHTCALLDNGTVTCWGYGGNGLLGDGDGISNNIGDDETPAANPVNGGIVALPGGQTATAVVATDSHTCALLANGTITCWGYALDGQLGYGNTDVIGDDETPATNPANGGIVALPGGRTATAIAAGGAHTCALLDNGTVTCWGYGDNGRLGYGNTNSIGDDETPAANPVNDGIIALPGGQTATAITAGLYHTCALLADGTLTCWGSADSGQLGYGNTDSIGDNETPAANPVNGGIIALPGGQTATAVSAGTYHTCALLADGTATCWGFGGNGRLGHGNTNNIGDNETPAANPVNGGIVSLPGGKTATAVDAASNHACALLVDGTSTCWGDSTGGRLGYGNTNHIGDDETPAANPANGGIVALPNHLSAIDYRALSPARLLDTRATGSTIDDQFEAGGIRTAGSTLQLDVAGRGGIPADATSITLSVAAVSPASSGFLTIWPCDATQPNASSLNYATGVNTANTVITGITGGVCIFTSKDTQLIADVVGFTPRSSTLTSLTPARYLDTRATGATFDDVAEADGQRTAGSTFTLQIANRGDVPDGTRTAILNVAAVSPAGNGFLTIWPCDAARPNASNLNYTAGVNTANLVITQTAAPGTVCIYTSNATHLIADVVGYYAEGTAPGPTLMHTVNPARLVDTRASGATSDNRYEKSGVLVANATNTYQITNRFPINAANVAVLTVTVAGPASSGFLTIWPCDQAKPNASSLNYIAGVNRAVQVLTKLSPNGTVCIASSKATHLIVDVNGTTM